MLLDTQNAVLLFTFLVTLLQNSDLEHEQLFIYESLREGVHRMPDALHVTYEMLIPKVRGEREEKKFTFHNSPTNFSRCLP